MITPRLIDFVYKYNGYQNVGSINLILPRSINREQKKRDTYVGKAKLTLPRKRNVRHSNYIIKSYIYDGYLHYWWSQKLLVNSGFG